MRLPNTATAILVAISCLAVPLQAQTPEQDRQQDHEELRAMLRTVQEAVSNQDADALIPLLHDEFSITMVDQTQVSSVEGLKSYFERIFRAEDSLLTGVRIEPEADVLTEFISDSVGVNRGRSTDAYTLKGGKEVVLESRWTATVLRTADGWKLSTAHAGVNILDNPLLAAANWMRYMWGGGGLVLGLLAGLGLGFLRKSR